MNIYPQGVPDYRIGQLVRFHHVIYAIWAVGLFTALPAFVAVILSYVKRAECRGTFLEAHVSWQIRTFWWALIWAAVGYLTLIFLVGFLILGAVYVWLIYRVARGWIRLADGRSPYA